MKKNKTKVFKASDGKKYKIHRDWCYDNIYFGPQTKNKNVKFIVIHNTGGAADKAINASNYLKNNRSRYAGAHFEIDEWGTIYQCARLKDAVYAVGGVYEKQKGGSKYLNKCTNYNSINIELCGITDNVPTKAQIRACKAVIEYIRKYRPKATKIIRHFDVNSKPCPALFAGPTGSPKGKSWDDYKKKVQ